MVRRQFVPQPFKLGQYRSMAALVFAATAVSACGGGGSDGGELIEDSLVGEYHYGTVTGKTIDKAANDPWATCGGDRYYETEWAVIYGDGGVSDESKAATAEGIERSWSHVLTAFAMTEADFQNRYRSIIINRYLMAVGSHVLSGAFNILDHSDVLDGILPTDIDTQDFDEWRRLVHGAAALLTTAELQQLIQDTAAAVQENPDTFLDVTADSGVAHSISYEPAKVVACIDSDMPAGSGTGMNWGIVVGPDARSDIIHHELVHYAQARLFGGAAYSFAPRWFTEGQATFLAHQEIAGNKNFNDLNPVEIEACAPPDWGVCAGDERYDLYGLSYQYIAEGTPTSDIKALMQDAYTATGGLERFKLRFGDYIKKPDGSPLTYEEYQRDYEVLLRDYF